MELIKDNEVFGSILSLFFVELQVGSFTLNYSHNKVQVTETLAKPWFNRFLQEAQLLIFILMAEVTKIGAQKIPRIGICSVWVSIYKASAG